MSLTGHTDIDSSQVVPMDAIAPDVQGLRILFVNVFAVTNPDGSWTLVDAGIPYSGTMIRNWAEKRFNKAPNAIVLTHGHFDHVSAAGVLADEWEVPIFAHGDEFPYLTGEKQYPPPDVAAGGGLMTFLSPMFPRGPVDLRPRLRNSGGTRQVPATIAELPDWQILHTPGHTQGHISLFRPSDRLLLPGDAFCTTKPESFFKAALTEEPELHGPPAYFTWNWDLARESVQRLAKLNPSIVAPGHGKPLAGLSVSQTLHELADHFKAVAIPHDRR